MKYEIELTKEEVIELFLENQSRIDHVAESLKNAIGPSSKLYWARRYDKATGLQKALMNTELWKALELDDLENAPF